jgi:crotonobetainyl-CoA:carnitine CoA-transferase CaiB-like acyl-CoA transferase
MKPLEGVRILAVEQFGAGPYGSLFLANLGAEVIKIENPATNGDAARHGGPFLLGENDSLYFQSWNTNKKSVTLDLKSAEGRLAFEKLVGTADAVFENMRGDQATKLGLDYPTLSKINRRIVCAHISAYGRTGERAKRPGYDFLMQAEAGLMSLTGDPDNAPARSGPSLIDFMCGMTLDVGLLACLLRAQKTGLGCDVDTSLFEVAVHQLSYSATWYLNANYAVTRLPRSSHFSATPVQTFRASDGWIFVMCMTQRFWERLIGALEMSDLGVDPRFATMAARGENRSALTDLLDAKFETHAMAYWVDLLGSMVPIGPVYDIRQALDNPFLQEIGMIQSVPHPLKADMRLLANPLRIDGKRLSLSTGSALGADNDVLASAGSGMTGARSGTA